MSYFSLLPLELRVNVAREIRNLMWRDGAKAYDRIWLDKSVKRAADYEWEQLILHGDRYGFKPRLL